MSKNNDRRVIRMDRFKAQIEERVLPPDGLVSIDLGDGDGLGIIKMRVSTLAADVDDNDPFLARVVESKSIEELALHVLSFNPDRSAEEQWSAFLAAGYSREDFGVLFRTESDAARERLGNFRYAG